MGGPLVFCDTIATELAKCRQFLVAPQSHRRFCLVPVRAGGAEACTRGRSHYIASTRHAGADWFAADD